MMLFRKMFTILCLLGIRALAPAAVEYCAATETIWVTDYPPDWPCTPRLLAQVDRTFGWGRVAVDEGKDTITVAANLVIGKNDGRPTWFQVGHPAHPRETLVVQGEVRVHSAWLADENSRRPGRDFASAPGNRLTLGSPGQTNINASLFLEKHERGAHRLVVGGFSGWSTNNLGGALHVYHSAIASLGGITMQNWEAGGHQRLVFSNAVVRDGGRIAVNLGRGEFVHTRFENCRQALHGLSQDTLRNCVFENCRTAIRGPSRNPLVLYDCVFRNNRMNWQMEWQPLVAIDCEIDDWSRGAYNRNASRDVFCVSKRHVVVRIMDANRKPVNRAQVRALSAGGARVGAPDHDVLFALTDAEGRTPGRGAAEALLLSEKLFRAGEGANGAPQTVEYAYTLEGVAGGRTARLSGFTPRHSWEVVTLMLDD